jgi:hypothetical protein
MLLKSCRSAEEAKKHWEAADLDAALLQVAALHGIYIESAALDGYILLCVTVYTFLHLSLTSEQVCSLPQLANHQASMYICLFTCDQLVVQEAVRRQ